MLPLLKHHHGKELSPGGRKEFEKSRRRPRFDAETRKCIGEILGLLNRFVTAVISGNLIVPAVEALERYMEDRPGFIRSVMLTLRLLHPEFRSVWPDWNRNRLLLSLLHRHERQREPPGFHQNLIVRYETLNRWLSIESDFTSHTQRTSEPRCVCGLKI